MAWFFTDKIINKNYHTFTGEDAVHICKSLRMCKGEKLTLCDKNSNQYDCTVVEITKDDVTVKIDSFCKCENEPNIKITLYQALTKGDKMEFIIQKAVELGVYEITPVITRRCVSRPDEKSMSKKITRWQKIALQAAMQSRRGIIPKVNNLLTMQQAAKDAGNKNALIIFYEGGGKSIREIVSDSSKEIAVFVGSEGGFDSDEVQMVLDNGGINATLGKRILRAETAPIAAIAAIMFETGNLG